MAQISKTINKGKNNGDFYVLGIDPGLLHTGWAIVQASGLRNGKKGPQAVAYGVISTKSDEDMNIRLATIYEGLGTIIERYNPTSAALEGVFFGLNAKTALLLGQARAAAMLATAARKLPLGEYPPATIKQTVVGTGNADKEQVAFMVRQLLALDHDPKPDHCTDALAVALTHLSHQ
jgi:crossover junction endodeoxyribonuclease RuvC